MRRFLLTTCVTVLFSFICACTHSDNNEKGPEVCPPLTSSPLVELKVPTGIYEDGSRLRVAVMLSHQFYTIESKAKNKDFIALIRRAIEKESLLTFVINGNTREILAVKEASAEDASKFKMVFGSVKGDAESLKVEPVIPDLRTLNELFLKIQNASCTFPVKKPCIPFNYPVDGCYARAHKMRQLLNESGYECRKEFIYGDLRARFGVKAPERGGCCVSWSYHVSVLVTYKDDKGVLQERIIDPSLFDAPVPDSEWRNACLNASCGEVTMSSFIITPGNVYYRSPKGTLLYDDKYVHTDCVLNLFADCSGCFQPAPSTASCHF